MLLGIVTATVISSRSLEAIASDLRDHELAPGFHDTLVQRADTNERDIAELKDMLREAIAKMDRYHAARE